MSNTVPKLSIFFSTAPPDLGRKSRPRLGFLRPILAFSALAIAALSASGQNITSTVNTNNEALAIDVISSQNTIYVTTGDNTLTAINGATNAVTVFNDPAAANTSGASAMVTYFNGVLVLNKNSNNITSYFAFLSGTSNQEQVQQIFSEPNTNQPVAIVLDPVNFGRIFVANAGSNSVSIFDNVNGNGWQLTASLTNIPDPQAMVINVNTHQVFVISGNSNTVTVIDGTSNAVRGTVQVGAAPKSLAFNTATNQVYVADSNAQSIVDIDANSLNATTILIPNSIPTAIAVNPVTNQIFEVSATGLVSIIDGATNTVTRTVTVAANDSPSDQAAIAVDPTTNLAYVEISGAQLYIIDGSTGSVSSVSSGTGGNAVFALNPITHKIYVDNGASGITVVDGATNAAGSIQPGQTQPYAVAVNPATNKIYVANFGSNTVSVIDGATNAVTAEVGTDSNPNAIAVDPARNLIFTTNFNSSSATVIDGSNNSATSVNLFNANPDSVAVNPVIGRVFGASSAQSVIFGFASNTTGSNLNFYPSFQAGPIAVAYNAATGQNFELDSAGALEAADGAFPARGITFVCPGSTPTSMAVNPVTNKVYVACTSGEIDAVANASGFTNGSAALFQDSAAVKPVAVAVNSDTNQIFIANAGNGTGNGSLTILDGASGNIANVPLTGTPVALAVNVATNKIYVQSQVDASSSSIIIVDGASQVVISTIGGFTAGPLTQQIAVNSAAGEVFAVNRTAGNVAGTLTTVTENITQPDGITTIITPFPGNTTASVTPTFNFTVHNTLDGATAYVVYYQIDSQARDWNFGGNISAQNFSGSITTPLTPGYHTVYAYAVTGDETSGNSSNNGVGFQNNPIVGSVASYGFMVAPPIAGGTILPIDFGTEPSGSQTAAHQAILTSVGAGPINFTYTITGANAADFKEVPYTGTDTLCNTLGGTLPSSNYCDVNLAFQPSATGPETATLTFTTNSMGVAGTTQTVLLTGLGTAATQIPLTVTFTGSGKVTDNLSLLNCTTSPCTQNYTPNQVVILTATPNSGSTFTGWSGACSGFGTCTVTMSQAQSVAAKFVSNGAGTCGANDAIWVGEASGNWSLPANWSTGAVPNGGTSVCINNNHSPASAVTLDINVSIGNLTINAGNSLTVSNNLQLTVAGTIANSGQITLISAANNTFLTLSGAVTLTGGGTITLNQTAGAQPILNNANAGRLINVNNLIQGAGQIGNNGLTVANLANGTFNANAAASQPLILNSGATNLGLLEASGNGVLQIVTTIVNKAGTISAASSASTVQLVNGADIQGGTITNSSGGSFVTAVNNGATLDGAAQGPLTVVGNFLGQNNTTTVLVGTINNTGNIQLTSAANNTFLTLSGAVTLTGAGTVTMNQTAGAQPILNNSNAGALINANNLIQGSGQIGNNGLSFTNQAAGVINANAAAPLVINSNNTVNLGLFEASGTGSLVISTAVVNKNATIKSASATATVQLVNGADIQGGTLTNTSGGLFITAVNNGATLDGGAQGPLTVVGNFLGQNNTTTVLAGTINNTGTIQLLSAANNTILTLSSTVTLTGGGTVFMNQTGGGQPILNNANAGALVNVNNLIQGAGQIGNNGLGITNQVAGVINANTAGAALGINNNITNLGLLEATGSGVLQLSVLVVNKTANIVAVGAAATVQLVNGANIQGGTINNSSGGSFITAVNNGATLDGAAQGPLTVVGNFLGQNNTTTVLAGTINNTGTIQILSAANNSFLVMSSTVTLTGGGTVFMNQTGGGQPILNNANAGALVNVNNLIQGAGQIGNNGLVITNQVAGVINANTAGVTLAINNNITNLGLLEATGSGVLQFNVRVVNQAGNIASVGAGATVQLINGADIQGGTINNSSGGSFITAANNGATLDGGAQGPLTVVGNFLGQNNTTTVLAGTINNTGTIQLLSAANNTILTLSSTVTLTGGGTVFMNQTAGGQPILNNANAGALVNANNRIQGAGQIGNNGLVLTNQAAGVILANAAASLALNSNGVTNAGLIVAAGSPTPGLLTVSNYTQTATGGFEIAIGGTTAGTQYSHWQDTGNSTLAGSLDIQLLGGFAPALGNTFTILNSNSVTGTFSKINSPALANGLAWNVTYNPTSVVLSVVASGGSGSATLTVTDLGTGTGTVTDDLGLINCTTTAGVISGTCSASYEANSVVVLTATPASGTTFSGWNSCAGTGTCSVTLNGNQSVNATFVPTGSTFPITLNTIGTGNGTVTDNVGQINCTTAAGVQSGTCSGTYPGGSIVALTAAPSGTSTFAGFGGGCTGASPCSVDVAGPQTVTASFAPAPQLITLSFPAGSTVSEMATFDCPSNPNPSPGNPCPDPNAHSLALSVPTVITPFTVTVQATEVPPSVADGLCPNGATPTTDFDCRFVSFFTYQTNANGDKVVPLCYPYANGNCVHYLVFSGQPGTEPPTADYVGPIDWTISWNNDHFIPPAPYLGSTPRVYDDPDYAVSPTSPFGTNCSTPMLVGNPPVATNPPIFCQFEFDITTFFNPTKPVDATIGARTKQFNDVVVAFPPANAGLVTVTNTPDAATVVAGNPIGFTVAIANNSGGTASNASLSDPLPAGAGVNWSISPAYTGPGTCAINGAVGAQELDCTFGNIPVNTSFSIHLTSPTSAAGTFTNAASVTVTNQQVLSIGTITVTAPTVVTAVFTGLTPSQSITAGTSSITLSGSVVGGNLFAPAGETVSITINGVTQPVAIGANGTFSKVFPTANIPTSATPYAIAYSYPGDANLSPASDSSTTLTVTPLVQLNFTLSVTEIGTGNGTVKDGQGLINCTTTAGVSSGTCSASYPSGTQVALTATPVAPSTFAGYGGACTGTGACSVNMTANQSVTASFAPAPQMITLSYAPGTTVQQMATFDCPSNANPSPTNPCLDPNAHSLALSVPTVITPFTVTVQATEVPPSVADGICPNGATPTTDFDCRFVSFFTYQTNTNGDKVVPLCYPYANGNCVHYLVFSGQPGTEPPTADYVGPIDWTISWNNDHFTPPAPYLGSTPRVYDDPDYAVSPTSPFGTNCSTPMLVGNPPVATNPPIFCQFEFDITTFFNPTKPVDATIGARTKQFNDVVVAFPPANAGLVTVTNTPDAATVVAGNPIGFTVAIANNSAGAATNATLKDPLPAGSGVNWSISPPYAGPGTCVINGAVGAQELDCTFGAIAVNASFTIHLVSASSSVGTFTNAAAVSVFNQQVLSIGTITVTGVTQTITFAATPTSAAYGTTFTASATASSGLPVTIAASGSCSIAGATATITSGTGTCTLTASQAGNTHYAPAMNVVHTVAAQKAASLATITATAPNPSVVAQPVTVSFKVTGAGTPTGSVSVSASTGETGTGTLSAGTGSCSITFSTTGTRTLTATYSGDGNFTSTVSAGFSQTVNPAAASQLSISPTNINFGQVLLGFLGVKFVTLTNKGTTPIAITKIAPSHTGTGDFADFDILNLCPKSLGAGKSCAVVVSFIPLHDNPTGVVSTSSILVTDNAAGSPQAITVSAQTINPIAKLSATQLSFVTPQKVGTTSPSQIITVTNIGSSPLVLGKITNTGADFTLPAAGTTCVAGESLAPTKHCTIAVAFAPKTKGLRIGTIQINDNALISPLLVRLIGQAN